MIAIIDSGSTKADWVFINGNENQKFHTPGMNPCFIGQLEIIRLINEHIVDHVSAASIEKIFFFGAGCSEEEQKRIISEALHQVFKNAKIKVEQDINGAVLSTCANEEGICCIIGTGSNSVYFDGKNIQPNKYGLGFILADEGAGTYLGKKLITCYLYGLLPADLSDKFRQKYNLSREDVIRNVYNLPSANTWLASFSQFLFEHKNDAWVRSTIKNGFEEFIQLYVLNYPPHRSVPVHFIGSIAFHYNDILKEIAKEKNIKLGTIIQKPIDGLVEYFIKNN